MKELYNRLMNLTQISEVFFYQDSVSSAGGKYRVFSYRLASYNDFQHEDSMEARGIMFEIDEHDDFVRLVARPTKKFFNAYENPAVMYDRRTRASSIAYAMDKLDGSVISTYRDIDNEIYTKSNTTLHSDHAIKSTRMLREDAVLLSAVEEADADGWTVTMEFTSPEHRIVLPYQEDKLTVLNLRHRYNGDMMFGNEMKIRYPGLFERSVFVDGTIISTLPKREFLHDIVSDIRAMTGIEGYVLVFEDGGMCKVKTDWYCILHVTRENVIVESDLYKAIVTGTSDDLKQMYRNDPYAIKKIEKMEQNIFMCYNLLVQDVEAFVAAHKHLDRKAFAAVVNSSLSRELNRQGLAYVLYSGREPDYKEVLLKQMKDVLKGF